MKKIKNMKIEEIDQNIEKKKVMEETKQYLKTLRDILKSKPIIIKKIAS